MPRRAKANEVAAAMQHCREITRRRARNFYYGLKLSPEPQRSALYVIYAWMRTADDLVDSDAHDGRGGATHNRINAFRQATCAALAGQPVGDDLLWVGLAETAKRFRLPTEYFDGMIDGQLDDLSSKQYDTFDQLRNYCYRVASTVGLVCIEVWGYEDEAAKELAIDRGIAFQLTNIIRDFKQDFDAGRIYLPREDFEAHAIDAGGLRRWVRPEACEAMLLQQIGRAEAFYARSAGLDEMICPRCRPTLWAMTSIYRGLLGKMRRTPGQLVTGRRVRLSAAHKALIALQARWQTGMIREVRNGAMGGIPQASGNGSA